MTKHADRIWRTVVFAGAMLGAPLISAADTKAAKPAPKAPDKQVKPAPPPADTVASVQKELDAVTKKIEVATKSVTDAQTDADRKAGQAKLEAARREKVDIDKRLAALKAKQPPTNDTPVAGLEKQIVELDTKIAAAADGVIAAQNEADRKAATAKLSQLRKDKVELENKLAAEKKAAQRPRTNESDKPIGRGFVLA